MILYGFFSYVHYAKIAKESSLLGALSTFYYQHIHSIPNELKILSPNSVTIVGPLLRWVETKMNLPKDSLKLSRHEKEMGTAFLKDKELISDENIEDFLSLKFPPFNESGNKIAYVDGKQFVTKMDLLSDDNLNQKIYTVLALCNTILIGQRLFLSILQPGLIESIDLNELKTIQRMITSQSKLPLELMSAKKISNKPKLDGQDIGLSDWYNTTDNWVTAYQTLVRNFPKLNVHNQNHSFQDSFVKSLKTIRLTDE